MTMTEVKIRSLEWHKSHITPWMDDWHTISPLIYTVRCADENGWRWSCNGAHGYAGSPDDAKEDAQAHFDATIRSALLPEVSGAEADGWQPIETAPKDGSEFLAHDGASTVICWWRERDVEGYLDGFPWRFVEIDDGSVSENGYSVNHPPKFWMPLPAPPLQTEGK